MTKRDDQRRETWARIVDVAVRSLVDNGYAATTAFGVQREAGISRGALLHHFPTSEALSAAAVAKLVELNLQAVLDESARTPPGPDLVARGVGVLYRASRQPSFAAELELWAAARADEPLRAALLAAERTALVRLYEVIDELFGPDLRRHPRYRAMVELTVQLMRGLTVSRSLGQDGQQRAVRTWTVVLRGALANTAP
ncbi:TetR/AcrR family transcriptional regulator [Amycolatopsis sp. WQ 127309]|uniref:TetR/AcrR family transcriptional regulator n=1 Tax=Amycolatopsis sp. WQ 127309 TaxID=2932773 RepID=UPI001FF232C4|nr:TetR/AcrR family transcriptional regulator [Amycolatopsis sp. WQ 127309]UOZ03486.1 TetR/AcrR family transcriptional regulator [Amycolatopsis sp. WQ 127309]